MTIRPASTVCFIFTKYQLCLFCRASLCLTVGCGVFQGRIWGRKDGEYEESHPIPRLCRRVVAQPEVRGRHCHHAERTGNVRYY